MTEATLVCEHVTVSYDRDPVLHDFNLTVGADEVVALLGPSGSGKTTVLAAVAGFVGLAGGSIRLHGREVATPRSSLPPERRDVGVVFQHAALWPHLSVVDTVAYPLRRQGVRAPEARRQAQRLLEAMSIAELADRRPAQLSGGQQQRVGLARALARSPSLYLFDEPTAHLDTALRASLHAELAARRRDAGAAAVYATHDAEESLAIADRIVVLRAGRIVQVGTPAQVYAEPVDPWAARLTGPASTLPATVVGHEDNAVTGTCLAIAGCRVRVSTSGVKGAAGAVRALLRPEWVRLGGALPGTVREVLFRGPHTDYVLTTPAGDVTARAPGHPRAAIGDVLTWEPSNAHLLPAATVSP